MNNKKNISFTHEHLNHHHNQDNYEIGVYENDTVIGYVNYTIYNNNITINDILVRPNSRREGFGSMLVKKMKELHPESKYKPSLKTDLGAKFIHKNNIDENFTKINFKKLEYHKKLNEKLWSNNILKKNVRKKLYNLAIFYFNLLKLTDNIKIKDIIITGSLANYNYTNNSDIDLHIIVDYTLIAKNKEFVKDFFNEKRKNWVLNNDIKIYDFPVEIFIEDFNDVNNIAREGIYSILKNKWLKKPKYKLPNLEKKEIQNKLNKYIDFLKKVNNLKSKKEKLKGYIYFLDYIGKLRKNATKNEGEFSTDNVIFKILRHKKIIEKIINLKEDIINSLFSIKNN